MCPRMDAPLWPSRGRWWVPADGREGVLPGDGNVLESDRGDGLVAL